MGKLIRLEKHVVSLLLTGIGHFNRFSLAERFSLWIRLATIGTCGVGFLMFVTDVLFAAQGTPDRDTLFPSTAYEVREYDQLQEAKISVTALKAQVDALEADRKKRIEAMDEWKQDVHDRLTRIEMFGSGFFVLITGLNTFGFLKKFRAAEEKLEERTSSGG